MTWSSDLTLIDFSSPPCGSRYWRSTVGLRNPDHSRHESQMRVAHLAGNFPASLGGKDKRTGLKSGVAVPAGDADAKRRRLSIEPSTLDAQFTAHCAPPSQLHAH